MGVVTDVWTFLYRDVFRESDYHFMTTGAALVNAVLYFGIGGLFLWVDLYQKPRWMFKYKTQPGANEPVDKKKLWHGVRTVLFNQMVIGGISLLLIHPMQVAMGSTCTPETLSSLLLFIRDFTCIFFMREVLFYYLHRLAHWGPLYRYIHKKHHEFQSPMALMATYAHPLEQLVVNVGSTAIPPTIMGSHLLVNLVWYSYVVFNTVIDHSGFHLPFMQSPEFHDYHHYKFVGNYGSIGLMDWLHDTSATFQKSPQYQRNQIFTGLAPMTTVYPDKGKDRNNNNNDDNDVKYRKKKKS